MKRSIAHSLLAAVTVLALAACSGGAAGTNPVSNPYPTTNTPPNTTGAAVLSKIVGVGDSLTAGEESNGLLGVTAATPASVVGALQPELPESQQFGWWADMYNAAHGANSANNVLPLMQSPGIGTFLVATATGFASPQGSCTGLNASAFSASTALSGTRVSPNTTPWDLGVPGQTVHEALYMTAPQGSCQILSAAPYELFESESTSFLPILGNFNGLSQVQAARSLNPTLTTVWLGANDLLKYAFSGGLIGPTPVSSLQTDLQTIVQTLQAVGSQVAIANLPDVLKTPLFIPIPNVPVLNTDPLPVDITALTAGAIPIATSTTIANGVVGANNLTVGAYILFQAMPAIIAVATGGPIPNNLTTTGGALTATLAASVQTENTAYNTAIAAVAASTNAAFVDIHSLFVTAAQSGVPVNPPLCCTLTINYPGSTGGLVGWDQLHPSYTGYAVIANAWISAIDAKFGTAIPQVSVAAAYAADPYALGSASYLLSTVRGHGAR